MSELIKLRDEVERLLTLYAEHRHSDDEMIRRYVHVALDRFLMENREAAALLVLRGINHAVKHDKDLLSRTDELLDEIHTAAHRRRDMDMDMDMQPRVDKGLIGRARGWFSRAKRPNTTAAPQTPRHDELQR